MAGKLILGGLTDELWVSGIADINDDITKELPHIGVFFTDKKASILCESGSHSFDWKRSQDLETC